MGEALTGFFLQEDHLYLLLKARYVVGGNLGIGWFLNIIRAHCLSIAQDVSTGSFNAATSFKPACILFLILNFKPAIPKNKRGRPGILTDLSNGLHLLI